MINLRFLFYIPNPLDWTTSQVSNIIQLVAAIATVGALWYAFYRDRKQDKKINDLAEITKVLSEQKTILMEQDKLQRQIMRVDAAPDFSVPTIAYIGAQNEGHVTIRNAGKDAIVTEIEFGEESATFYKKVLPLIIREGTSLVLHMKYHTVYLSECSWSLIVHYQDRYQNKYKLKVIGSDCEAKIDELISL